MEVLLSLELYQLDREISSAMYCQVNGVKQGYMYVNQGNISHEMGFGNCLLGAVQILHKSYRTRSLSLAFPEGYLDIIQDSIRVQIQKLLNDFVSYRFVPIRFNEQLEAVNQMGKIDDIPVGKIHGYTIDEVEARKNNLAKEVKAKRKMKMPPDYDGIRMPQRGVIIDFEASSTHVKFARIFEAAAVKFENGVIVDRFQSFTNPGINIPKAIRTLTGIKQSDIDAAPKTFIVMKQLLKFIDDAPVLVGHNLHTYDYELLRLFIERFRMRPWEGHLLCTRRLARKIQLVSKDYKLETLCQLFGIENKSAHRALADCEATFELLHGLYSHTLLG